MTDSKPSPLEIDVERDDAERDDHRHRRDRPGDERCLARRAQPRSTRCPAVHLDLSSVEYMDSTGLRTVLVAKGEIERAGGSLDVVAASNIVSRLIEITGIEGLIAG